MTLGFVHGVAPDPQEVSLLRAPDRTDRLQLRPWRYMLGGCPVDRRAGEFTRRAAG